MTDAAKLRSRMLDQFAPNLVCSEHTDLVVEGYPRSGNTLTADLLTILSQRDGVSLALAHHTHSIDNLRLGEVYNVQRIVLIRQPQDAILSASIYLGAPPSECAERYLEFYRSALALQSGFVVACFEDFIPNFNRLIHTINILLPHKQLSPIVDQKHDYRLAQERDAQRADKVHGTSASLRVGYPTQEREAVKKEKRAEVVDLLPRKPEIFRLYEQFRQRSVDSATREGQAR